MESVDDCLFRALTYATGTETTDQRQLHCASILVALECRLILLPEDLNDLAIALYDQCTAPGAELRATLIPLLADTGSYPESVFRPFVERLRQTCNQKLLQDGAKSSKKLLYLLELFAESEANTIARVDPSLFHLPAIDASVISMLARAKNRGTAHHFFTTYGNALEAFPKSLMSVDTKAKLLNQELNCCHQQWRRQDMLEAMYAGPFRAESPQSFPSITVNRTDIVASTISELDRVTRQWNRPLPGIYIQFSGEIAQDAGGPRKEWLLLLITEILQSCAQDPSLLFSDQIKLQASTARCLGASLALSLLHQVVVDVSIPTFYFAILAVRDLSHHQPTLDDLAQIDESLARGLSRLLDLRESIDSSIAETMGLHWQDHARDPEVSLSMSNRDAFVKAYIRQRLMEANYDAIKSFHDGFHVILSGPHHFLRCMELFSGDQLAQLVRGEEMPLDAEAMRRHCQVQVNGNADAASALLEWFWRFVSSLKGPKAIASLYRFITASHRTSVIAKDVAKIHFTIVVLEDRDLCEQGNIQDLPRSSTCTNTLFLPRYPTEARLFEKFHLALAEGSNTFALP